MASPPVAPEKVVRKGYLPDGGRLDTGVVQTTSLPEDLVTHAKEINDAAERQGRMRYFVLLVVGQDKDHLTFEGMETTWQEFQESLKKVSNRSNTVLQFALASKDFPEKGKEELVRDLIRLVKNLGFEYLSDTGIKPLGSKGDAPQFVSASADQPDLLPEPVIVYIIGEHFKAVGEAMQKGLPVNTQSYGVDGEGKLYFGGLLEYRNTSKEPQAGPIYLGNMSKDEKIILIDEAGQEQDYEFRVRRIYGIGKFGLWWKPAEPVSPGASRLLGYIRKQPRQLPVENGLIKLKMSNHFGSAVIENFFLVVPVELKPVEQDVPPTSKKIIGQFAIYLFQQHVPAGTTHEVNLALKPIVETRSGLVPSTAQSAAPVNEELQGKLKTWVERFFSENYRDITARKTLEWGQPEVTAGGNLSIRYKYQATIWNKDQMIIEQRFIFTPEGKYVSAETIERGPASQPMTQPTSAPAKESMSDVDRIRQKLDLSSPEATIKAFTIAAAKGDIDTAMACIRPDSHDYDDTAKVLAKGSSHPMSALIAAIDPDAEIEIEKMEFEGPQKEKCMIWWKVTLAKPWSIEERGQTILLNAGQTFTFDGTVVKTGDIWLIAGI